MTYCSQEHSTRDQLELTQRQLKLTALDERPWVYTNVSLSSELPDKNPNLTYYGKDGIKVALDLNLRNYGKTPALQLRISWEIHSDEVETGNAAYDAQKKICDPLRQTPFNEIDREHPAIYAPSLFPNQPFEFKQKASNLPDALVKGSFSYKVTASRGERVPGKPFVPAVPVFIVGCVDYSVPGDPHHHQTGFVYRVTGQVSVDHQLFADEVPVTEEQTSGFSLEPSTDDPRTFAAD